MLLVVALPLAMLGFEFQARAQSCPGSLPSGIDCVAYGAAKTINYFSVAKQVTNSHASGKAIMVPVGTSGNWSQFYSNPPLGVSILSVDSCAGTPLPGTVCVQGTVFLGVLDSSKYMTTPGGCDDIPAGQRVGSGPTAYPNADFTPTCAGGIDSLLKHWNDGSDNFYDIPGLYNVSNSSIWDTNFGSANTTAIVSITAGAQGGYHAAARYCDRLVYGGFSDWYLPNNKELNLFYTNRAYFSSLVLDIYWSSSEDANFWAWHQNMSNGDRISGVKNLGGGKYLRCVRRY